MGVASVPCYTRGPPKHIHLKRPVPLESALAFTIATTPLSLPIGCPLQGKGQLLERLVRELRVAVVGGGSEEVMLDLSMRQAKL